jgi:hypothetical protein
MHQRLPALAAWILSLGLATAAAQTPVPAAAPSAEPIKKPVQGLLGHYYTRDLPGSYDLKGFLPDIYGIPLANKKPNAIRVDAQIAFGKGKGFVPSEGGSQLVWWTPAEALAVVWKGYIRLPAAGTYYLTTASRGASAVYLNSARVSLNGGFGGSVPSDKFSLDESGTGAAYSANHGQYVVPISVTGPRVMPIEVRYQILSSSGVPRGIDLYWVTPDAPRDSKGTPIAAIVPPEALFVEPPAPVSASIVSGSHSTISSDVLYLPDGADDLATLTIRVADKAGKPIAGKQVLVSSLQFESGGDGNLIQPQAPTNAQGIATAQYKMTSAHNRRFFATVLDDTVDVGQEAEILGQRGQLAFLPLTYAPYYGGKHFLVTPLPLTQGQLTTISVPLMNRMKVPYEVSVRVLATVPNIGAYNFGEIGRTETFVLKPGESRQVKVGWTPKEAGGKLCFKVEVWGRPAPAQQAAMPGLNLFSVAFAQPPVPAPHPTPAAPPKLMDSRQHNIGPVNETDYGADKGYWTGVQARSEDVVAVCIEAGKISAGVGTVTAPAVIISKPVKRILIGAGKQVSKKVAAGLALGVAAICAWAQTSAGVAELIASDPPDPNFQEVYPAYDYQLPPLVGLESVPAAYAAALDAALRNQLEIISLSTAVLVSLERYQGAKAARDGTAAAKQSVAYMNYTNQVAQKFERGAVLLENLVAASRAGGVADVVVTAEQLREGRKQLASTGFSGDLLEAFAWVGVSQEFLDQQIVPAALRADPKKAAGSFNAKLLGLAAAYRSAGAALARKSRSITIVANPRDESATVDLYVHRASLPADWKLSLVNADDASADKSAPQVQEITAGRHYRVTIPAKGQFKVASVVEPVGLAENTTARWAVEGRIGNELLGGIVHEMNVPAELADLPTVTPTTGAATAGYRSLLVWLAAAISVLLIAGFLFMAWRRKRSRA